MVLVRQRQLGEALELAEEEGRDHLHLTSRRAQALAEGRPRRPMLLLLQILRLRKERKEDFESISRKHPHVLESCCRTMRSLSARVVETRKEGQKSESRRTRKVKEGQKRRRTKAIRICNSSLLSKNTSYGCSLPYEPSQLCIQDSDSNFDPLRVRKVRNLRELFHRRAQTFRGRRRQ